MLDTAKLARIGFLRKYPAGEIICRQGEPGAEMYIVLQGEVEVMPGGGGPVILKAGDFFGEIALFDRAPHSATVRAATETVLLVLAEENFKEVIEAEPLLALRIMKGMSERLRELDKELQHLKQIVAAGGGQEASGAGGGGVKNEPFVGSGDPDAGLPSLPDDENYSGPGISSEAREGVFPAGAPEKPGENNPDVNSGRSLPAAAAAAAPVSQERVLYTKKVACPVCRFVFPATAFMASKLRTVRQDTELRNHYAGFEPLLYSVWVCPECYYAGQHDSFNQLNARQKAVLKENAPARRQKFGPLMQEGSPARAIQGYLLVLENLARIDADSVQKGRAWLRLAWLYDDAGDGESARQARQNALTLFEQAYFSSTKTLTPEQEQQMAYLIGELKYRLGDQKEALHFWRRAATQQGGNAQFTRQVQDRIYEVRSMGRKN